MKANKVLGQHFLTSRTVVQRIVAAANIQPTDTVLEVGPGKGVLTQFLIEKAKKVIAVEKDAALVLYLREKFKDRKNFKVVEGDILKPGTWNLEPATWSLKLEARNSSSKLQVPSYKIVANIPYYITARFLRLMLEEIEHKPLSMTLMVQREVADRITATPPHMNLLALSVQAFGTPKKLFRVSRGNFSPPPGVDSAVITISDISDIFFKQYKISQKEFFATARKAFSQKRKMLRSSIRATGEFATKRPQELSPEDFVSLLKSDFNRDKL